ncbi:MULTISPECIES: hypothetical protein [Klebsiella pneumoniae complex]|uniref:hypothetical protein n=1 Tax=Klebsiella pneumoniae complex TaxID=3390273 RepID=UPI00164BEB9C|nr:MULTISPECIES: hypothetical protein [Klebsiella]HBQ6092460.1 hypothetical protein [Klebsiella pneumoniae subsp. pneumoniae]HCM5778703.1 hypothetical protein [Klebsiella variicola subsp. variicola]MBC4423910.1 hypothetical protein [Klebsiella variicola]MDE8351138.1 hypothetical protein [Klebsiella pneumoniae]MEC5512370.1 hypothetical protein [Klebsiella pneumoniae]
MQEYDTETPVIVTTGVVPDDADFAFSAEPVELVIEGFDSSGFHLRIGDSYYCAKNSRDLIAICIDFFGGGNNDCYR